jgi:hypothetical protein
MGTEISKPLVVVVAAAGEVVASIVRPNASITMVSFANLKLARPSVSS